MLSSSTLCTLICNGTVTGMETIWLLMTVAPNFCNSYSNIHKNEIIELELESHIAIRPNAVAKIYDLSQWKYEL